MSVTNDDYDDPYADVVDYNRLMLMQDDAIIEALCNDHQQQDCPTQEQWEYEYEEYCRYE